MIPAFYIPPQDWGEPLNLTGSLANHGQALRLRQDENVLILDGEGKQALCRVAKINKKSFELEKLEESFSAAPTSRAIMAIAMSKAARRGFFMEKAAELGAWEIWLWRAARSQYNISMTVEENCRGRLIAGLEQSRNPWLPRLRSFTSVNGILETSRNVDWRVLPWENQGGLPMLSLEQLGRNGSTVYAIGPEGGFTPEEVQALFDSGFTAASLGTRVLRCETAATLCLGLHWWASQLPGTHS